LVEAAAPLVHGLDALAGLLGGVLRRFFLDEEELEEP
jgi:hypothetical protein